MEHKNRIKSTIHEIMPSSLQSYDSFIFNIFLLIFFIIYPFWIYIFTQQTPIQYDWLDTGSFMQIEGR